MLKIIVAGSRSFNDFELLEKTLDELLKNRKDVEIVSGTANGADKLGERYAKRKDLTIKQFYPDWNRFGKGAGYIRNEEMAKYADGCVCFWNRQSKGTKNMINLAKKYNLQLKIVYV